MRPSNTVAMKALDASADQVSVAIPTTNVFAISAQAVMTGTSSGTLKFEASNDPTSLVGGPTNWSDIASQTVTITGTPGTFLIPQFGASYEWIRMVYTKNNGSAGTITVNVKSLGN